MKLQAVSGQRHFRKMTNKLNERQLEIVKVNNWMVMLNNSEKPMKWLKTTSRGTKVNFDFIKSEEEYEKGLDELQEYLNVVNDRFSLGFSISRE